MCVLLKYTLSLIIPVYFLFSGKMIQMTNRQKKGISTVLTTLIIVVASVVLGTAVTLFGTSLFQTGSQQQGIAVSNLHVWQGANSTVVGQTNQVAEGSFVVRNTGDRLVAVDSIKIRGASVPFTSWYASEATDSTDTNFQKAFKYMINPDTDKDLDNDAADDLLQTAAGIGLIKQNAPVTLEPGKGVIIFFILSGSNDTDLTNDVLTTSDVGASTSVSVFAGSIGQVQTVTVARTV